MTSIVRHILVPHDFSETARHALDYALALAPSLGARITILHAYEIPVYGIPESPVVTAEGMLEIQGAAQRALETVLAAARRPDLQVGAVLRQGVPWSEIQSAASELKVDLIVIGTHGRKGLARALLGSVAEKVVRTAPCPVLTIHAPDAAPPASAAPAPTAPR
jgi:nucleotide-binding universal stress UspA family protein